MTVLERAEFTGAELTERERHLPFFPQSANALRAWGHGCHIPGHKCTNRAVDAGVLVGPLVGLLLRSGYADVERYGIQL